MLGFGDKVGEKMRECFALNGNDENPEVVGVAGIFEAYKKTLENIELSGPTLLSPVFEKAIELIKKKNRDNKFHIMLILTDGVVDDMEKTKEK